MLSYFSILFNPAVGIEVSWTGSFPNLCSGRWEINIDGIKLDIPEDVATSPMDTKGEYMRWRFVNGWNEEWEMYTDGLPFHPWMDRNYRWLSRAAKAAGVDFEYRDLYAMIQSCDWRHGSCGGCI